MDVDEKKAKPEGLKNDSDNEIDDLAGSGLERGSISKLPSRPHPAVSRLETLSFDTLPEGFFVIAYGARRTGKSHGISNLVEEVKDRFDFAYLFSCTAGLHKGSKDFTDFEFIRDEAKFDGYDEEILGRIIERQKSVMKFNNECEHEHEKKPNKTLLIFDDFVHIKEVRYSKMFTELPVLGRHYELSVICLSQGYSSVAGGGLNTATRQNADLVMTFLPRNQNDVERISEWYLTKDKVENMWFTKSVCSEKHTSLAINLTQPHETEYENYCYVYKAPPTIPKFELGKIQWKLYKEELKRQRKACMAADVENERSICASLSTMEKFQRTGVATGGPDQKYGRPSLFEFCNQGI